MYAHHSALDPTSAILIVVGGLLVAVPRIGRLRATIPIFGKHGVEVSINDLQQAVAAANKASTVATRAGDRSKKRPNATGVGYASSTLSSIASNGPFHPGAYVRAEDARLLAAAI